MFVASNTNIKYFLNRQVFLKSSPFQEQKLCYEDKEDLELKSGFVFSSETTRWERKTRYNAGGQAICHGLTVCGVLYPSVTMSISLDSLIVVVPAH